MSDRIINAQCKSGASHIMQTVTLCWNGSDKVFRLSSQDSSFIKIILCIFTYPEDILISDAGL